MGTSCWEHISTAIEWIRGEEPKSVLDVGAGFGKWGFLCREYLDVYNGRHFREDWKTRIVGMEGFERYIHPASRYLYDDIVVGDALVKIHEVGLFDLIIMGDILEHFTRHWANSMLANAVAMSQAVLVVTPGGRWPQGAVHGNEYERHRTVVKYRHVRNMFRVLKHATFENDGRGYWMALLEGHQVGTEVTNGD